MNKDEIALDYKKELKKRISADYERRVKQWMAADPSQLIDAAEEITAARLIRDNIEDAINEEDARFLLGLDEPLDELADRWIAENGLDASHGEELLHCVWTLREELSDDAGTRTVRDFLATHVGGIFSLMTPCGFVPLTAAQAERLILGNLTAKVSQVQEVISIHEQEAALFQCSHRMANAGLGHIHVPSHIHGAYHASLLLENKNRFQVIFTRFV